MFAHFVRIDESASTFKAPLRPAGKFLQPGLMVVAGLALMPFLMAAASAQSLVEGRASVIDGDTIEMQGKRIRLHGIDAPESAQTCERIGKPWRCGQAAALALSDWIGAAIVTCRQSDTDRYKRIVARCSKSGQDLGGWMVANGWALDWPRYSKGYYAGAQQRAKDGQLGIWGSTFAEPWEWRANKR